MIWRKWNQSINPLPNEIRSFAHRRNRTNRKTGTAEDKMEKDVSQRELAIDPYRTSRDPEKKRASRKVSSEIMGLMKSKLMVFFAIRAGQTIHSKQCFHWNVVSLFFGHRFSHNISLFLHLHSFCCYKLFDKCLRWKYFGTSFTHETTCWNVTWGLNMLIKKLKAFWLKPHVLFYSLKKWKLLLESGVQF